MTAQYCNIVTNDSSILQCCDQSQLSIAPEQLLPVAERLGALCGVVVGVDRLAERCLHHGQLGQVQVGLLGEHAAAEILSLLVKL